MLLLLVGSRLALGVGQSDGEVDCDIWDLIGSGVVGEQIVVPPFTGDVFVSNTELRFTFVPVPSSLVLVLMLAVGCSGRLTAVLARYEAKS